MKWTKLDLESYQMRRRQKPSPATTQQPEALESAAHTKIAAELDRRNWYYVHSRMDRKTTQAKGVPDFIIAMPGGQTLWLEVKRSGEKLSAEQNITRHLVQKLGHRFEVVFSLKEFMGLTADGR